jgi:hypothetical protein
MTYEFRDSQEIIARLARDRSEIAKQFERREQSIERIVELSVGGNTFRSFRGLSKKPSVVFREWATAMLVDNDTTIRLEALRSQTDYDGWLQETCCAFRSTWQARTGIVMPYGASRKLPDLLIKHFAWWSGLPDNLRDRLIAFLHVPLDSFTLVGIRNCVADPEIPSNATMKFVAGPTMYNQIQRAILEVTDQAKVPAIYFDVLAWNMGH